MALLETKNFGAISFTPESVFEFPQGLPGFEERRKFVPVQTQQTAPMVFLQSLEEPDLCFMTMPVLALEPQYHLTLNGEECAVLEWRKERAPQIGDDVMCLAVLSVRESGPTANLLAPVVINLSNHKAVQAVAAESEYSHQHALFPQEATVCS